MARSGPGAATLIGFIVGVGALIGGFLLDGGSIISLVGIPALIVIVGGTFGALLVSFNLSDVLAIPKLIIEALKPARSPSPQLVEAIIQYAEKARRDGLLALEETVEQIEDETLRKGMKLVVDGTDADAMVQVIESDIQVLEARKKAQASVFETAGGFSPTMGIIGTVMGLVLVLSHLGSDTNTLGHAISTAFIATLYGIGLANLFWLPIANKLKYQGKQMRLEKELILTGVRSIQQGESPSLVWERLEGFLDETDRQAISASRSAG